MNIKSNKFNLNKKAPDLGSFNKYVMKEKDQLTIIFFVTEFSPANTV